MKGIYQYKDLKTEDIVYVGKDSNIDKNVRYKTHLRPSAYNKQPFNRVIQNNPERYEYQVICQYEKLSDDELNWFECMEIMKHKFLYGERPKFNFTVGGDGNTGLKHTEETKRKISESNKGNTHSEETRKKMSEDRNNSGYLNVGKTKHKTCKQGFIWRYRYYENGKPKSITSTDIEKLEEKVKSKGLNGLNLKRRIKS